MNGEPFTLEYDAEGHVVSVTGSGYSAQFTYDGDGKRVKSVINGETILFVGSYYEVKNPGSGQQVTKYYYAGSQRIAMRRYTIPQSMSVEFILSDHLGSTAVTTDSTGQKVSELRYTPCPLRFAPGMLREGEVRYAWHDASLTTTPAYSHSRWTYTGQYSYADDPSTLEVEDFGLLYFNARWVDPQLGHFVQADSVIPGAGNSQAWDRYAYGLNSPVRYNDPSGHCAVFCLAIGIGVALIVWLANPEPVFAPGDDFLFPADVDNDYGDKAYFDAAPGTGDISDVYSIFTGRTLFTGEKLNSFDRIMVTGASILPIVTGGTLRNSRKAFDIVKYGDEAQGFVRHHGVMDVWAAANIPGYISRNSDAPTMILTAAQHAEASKVYYQWRKQLTGSITGKIDWTKVSPQEIRALADQMFEAAGVPEKQVLEYYKAFEKYLYEELP